MDTAGLTSAVTFSGPGWWELDGADGASRARNKLSIYRQAVHLNTPVRISNDRKGTQFADEVSRVTATNSELSGVSVSGHSTTKIKRDLFCSDFPLSYSRVKKYCRKALKQTKSQT